MSATEAKDDLQVPDGGGEPMTVSLNITLFVNELRLSQWQLDLCNQLARAGHSVTVVGCEGSPWPLPLRLLTMLETLVYRLPPRRPGGTLAIDDWAASFTGETDLDTDCDLLIDLSASTRMDRGKPVLQPLYNGQPDELAAVAAILDGQLLTISIAGTPLISGEPAREDGRVLSRALDPAFAAVSRLLQKAVRQVAQGRGAETTAEAVHRHAPPQMTPGIAGFAACGIVNKLSAKLTALCHGAPTWSVGWRFVSEGRIQDTLSLPDEGFSWLPHHPGHYFADPFVIGHQGRIHVFCEDYELGAGKGLISAFELREDGSVTAPRPVLERGCHLSYPFVFEHGGTVWMIPESSADRTVDLYRADPFPHRWTHAACLLEDVTAADATLVHEAGKWWLFATTSGDGGSSWDTLNLYMADALEGPYRPHDMNPVLVDARSARPAGSLFARDGALWRPAQDCSGGYGSGIALARIDRMDESGFSQSVAARLAPPPAWKASGLHTVNWAAGVEVIDRIGRRSTGAAQ